MLGQWLWRSWKGSGRGAVGRAVASNTRGPGFESSHRQLLLDIYLLLTVCGKDEDIEKEAENDRFFKKVQECQFEKSQSCFTTLS